MRQTPVRIPAPRSQGDADDSQRYGDQGRRRGPCWARRFSCGLATWVNAASSVAGRVRTLHALGAKAVCAMRCCVCGHFHAERSGCCFCVAGSLFPLDRMLEASHASHRQVAATGTPVGASRDAAADVHAAVSRSAPRPTMSTLGASRFLSAIIVPQMIAGQRLIFAAPRRPLTAAVTLAA